MATAEDLDLDLEVEELIAEELGETPGVSSTSPGASGGDDAAAAPSGPPGDVWRSHQQVDTDVFRAAAAAAAAAPEPAPVEEEEEEEAEAARPSTPKTWADAAPHPSPSAEPEPVVDGPERPRTAPPTRLAPEPLERPGTAPAVVGSLTAEGLDDDDDESSEDDEPAPGPGPGVKAAAYDEDSEDELEVFDVPSSKPKPKKGAEPTGDGSSAADWNEVVIQDAAPPPSSPAPAAEAPAPTPAALGEESVLATEFKSEGTLDAKASAAAEEDEDDEFGYAFEGEKRQGTTFVKEFKPQAAPSHLITNVKSMDLNTLTEEGEEEEEEGEEEEAAATEEPEPVCEEDFATDPAAAVQPAPVVVSDDAVDVGLVEEGAEAARAPPAPAVEVEAEEDWEVANAERDAALKAGAGEASSAPARITPLTYNEVELGFMKYPGLRAHASKIVVSEAPKISFFQKLLSMCTKSAELPEELHQEREMIFCLAKQQLDDSAAVQVQALHTIYMHLTGKEAKQRYGAHWEEIGFQGNDPATDLRGGGILSVLQMSYLIHHSFPNASQMYELSRDPQHEYPLAPMSINVTGIALQALRYGLLNSYAAKKGSVLKAVNDYYVCLMYRLHTVWQEGGKTIRDAGFVKKDLTAYAHSASNVSAVYALLSKRLGTAQAAAAAKRAAAVKGSAGAGEQPLEFADLG